MQDFAKGREWRFSLLARYILTLSISRARLSGSKTFRRRLHKDYKQVSKLVLRDFLSFAKKIEIARRTKILRDPWFLKDHSAIVDATDVSTSLNKTS